MAATATKLRSMAPRQRKVLSKTDTDYKVRFAVHLRALLEKAGLSSTEFLAELHKQGVEVDLPAVNCWLRGEGMPRPDKMPAIGAALKMPDYRKLWPPK